MALGYDGFGALKDRKFIIDDENGQIMSSIIRSFLLGMLDGTADIDRRIRIHLPTQRACRRSPEIPLHQNIIFHFPSAKGESK